MFCAYQRICHKQDGGGDEPTSTGEQLIEVENAQAFMLDFYNRISSQ